MIQHLITFCWAETDYGLVLDNMLSSLKVKVNISFFKLNSSIDKLQSAVSW